MTAARSGRRTEIAGYARRRWALWLAPALTAFLLLAQSVDLVHNHNGELEPRFDCEICLKLGSNTIAAVPAEFAFHLSLTAAVDAGEVVAAPFLSLQAPRSRAPPAS